MLTCIFLCKPNFLYHYLYNTARYVTSLRVSQSLWPVRYSGSPQAVYYSFFPSLVSSESLAALYDNWSPCFNLLPLMYTVATVPRKMQRTPLAATPRASVPGYLLACLRACSWSAADSIAFISLRKYLRRRIIVGERHGQPGQLALGRSECQCPRS